MKKIIPDQALYVMQNQFGLIKIGRSLEPEHRRKALEHTENCRLRLVLALEGQGQREEELHDRLDRHRLAGEWFDGIAETRAAVQRELDCATLAWKFPLDPLGANSWLEGFLERQNSRYVQREISRFHTQLRALTEPSWVWDSRLWDLHWLMELGVRPSGSVETDEFGKTIHRSWIDGRELVVPRFTSDLAAALELWPEGDRPVRWSGSTIECCKAAIDVRRTQWRKRYGLRGPRPKPTTTTSPTRAS